MQYVLSTKKQSTIQWGLPYEREKVDLNMCSLLYVNYTSNILKSIVNHQGWMDKTKCGVNKYIIQPKKLRKSWYIYSTQPALTYVWRLGFLSATQGMILDRLALVARKVCVPRFLETNNSRDSPWQSKHPKWTLGVIKNKISCLKNPKGLETTES